MQASQTLAYIKHLVKKKKKGSHLWTKREKRKAVSTKQTEIVPALELDPIAQAVGNKDQPNKVMVSLSNKVTAQLC